MTLGERHLAFKRAINFRDMGGYPTSDGRHTRWSRLFRSGQMSQFTAADLVTFRGLGIETIYDFRASEERANQPSAVRSVTDVRLLPIVPPFDNDLLIGRWLAREVTDDEVNAQQDAFYLSIIRDQRDRYRELFMGILNGGGTPLLIHCAGGKDRTGIAAALILSALDVSRDVILADYMMTLESRAIQLWADKLARRYAAAHDSDFDEARTRATRLFGTCPQRLALLFKFIEEDFGSVKSFLHSDLNVGPSEVARLQTWYLTRPE